MYTVAIAINKQIQVQINTRNKSEMLKINAWYQLKASSFKHWVLDTGKEINAGFLFKEIHYYITVIVMYVIPISWVAMVTD